MPHSEEHLTALMAYRINSMGPFSLSPGDTADQCLKQAHALCLLSTDAVIATEDGGAINPEILANAFQGIATLVALADFALSGEVQ